MLQHKVLHVLNFWASFCDLYSRKSAVESCFREGLRVNLLQPKGMSVTPVPGLFIQITASKKFLPHYREQYYNTWRPENIQSFKCAALQLSDRCISLIARAFALPLCLASAGEGLPKLFSPFVHWDRTQDDDSSAQYYAIDWYGRFSLFFFFFGPWSKARRWGTWGCVPPATQMNTWGGGSLAALQLLS